MCKLCNLAKASEIDNMNANTSLQLANAAASLFANARNKEGDELVKAALSYWREPKEAAAAELMTGDAGAAAAQTEAPGRQIVEVAVNADGSYVTQGPVHQQGFHLDRDSGELYLDGKYLGDLQVSRSLFGDTVLFKQARR